MKLKIFGLLLPVAALSSCVTEKALPPKHECEVLNKVIEEIMAEEKLTVINVGKD